MGTALCAAFSDGYTVVQKNSRDFDAFNFAQVNSIVTEERPDIVMNTVAMAGIDACEKEPLRAFELNALLPKLLAELSVEQKFFFVHFSTDAVFNDLKQAAYSENDIPSPVNTYGVTKYAGDCYVAARATDYYIARISVLFGPTSKQTQFVEKMLQRVREGQRTLRISGDIIATPTYSIDVAAQLRHMLETGVPRGLYHLVNAGQGSLYELMQEIAAGLDLEVEIERVSHRDFASVGVKNTYTPLVSEKIAPLRPWKDAVRDYCRRLTS
jgi:dTDP-4-dehydrorhamnose reductase